MHKAMAKLVIPLNLIKLVKATMTGTTLQMYVEAILLDPLEIHNGLREGEAIACLLFNVALDQAIRDSRIQTAGHIFQKSLQVLPYVDDIVILGRRKGRLDEAFLKLYGAI